MEYGVSPIETGLGPKFLHEAVKEFKLTIPPLNLPRRCLWTLGKPRSMPPKPISLSALERVPDEVLLEIIGCINGDKFTMGMLSLCSKRLHDIIEPTLYSTYDSSGHGVDNVPYFLRTLVTNKRIRSLVKNITLPCDENTAYDMDDNVFLKREWNMLRYQTQRIYKKPTEQSVWNFNQQIAAKFERLVGGGNSDAVVAVLLCLLPNLEEIHVFDLSDCDGYPYIESIMDRAANLQLHTTQSEFAFRKLRSVRLSRQDYEYFPFLGLGVLRMFPFISIPSVTTFSGHMFTDNYLKSPAANDRVFTETSVYRYPFPDFKFTTKHLSLKHSAFGSGPCAIFRTFTSLETLENEFRLDFENDFQSADEYGFHPWLNVIEFSDCIQHLQGTLRKLTITQDRYCSWVEAGPGEDQPFPTLRNFKKLEILKMSADLLLGRILNDEEADGQNLSAQYTSVQIDTFLTKFPRSLEKLTMTYCDIAILSVIIALVTTVKERFPRLSTIHLEFKPDTKFVDGRDEPRLKSLSMPGCKAAETWGDFEAFVSSLNITVSYSRPGDECLMCSELYNACGE